MEPVEQIQNQTEQQQPALLKSKFGKKKLILIGVAIFALVILATFLFIFFNSKQNQSQETPPIANEKGTALLYFEPKSMNYQTNESVTLPLFLQTSNTQVDEMIINLEFNPSIFSSLDLVLGPQTFPTSPYYEVIEYRVDTVNGIATFTVKIREGVGEIPETAEVLQISFTPIDFGNTDLSSITISETTSLQASNKVSLELANFELLFSASPSSPLAPDAGDRLQQQTDLIQSE